MPLKTRAGSALAPTEPGARTLWEPWVSGPRLKLWRLIVPWKPLPIETAETLTRWPGSKLATVTSSPTFRSEDASSPSAASPSPVSPSAASPPPAEPPTSTPRNSTSVRIAVAPAFFRWPSSALVSLSSGVTGSAASWTAS